MKAKKKIVRETLEENQKQFENQKTKNKKKN